LRGDVAFALQFALFGAGRRRTLLSLLVIGRIIAGAAPIWAVGRLMLAVIGRNLGGSATDLAQSVDFFAMQRATWPLRRCSCFKGIPMRLMLGPQARLCLDAEHILPSVRWADTLAKLMVLVLTFITNTRRWRK